MNITGVSRNSSYQNLSGGKKINSAADNAAGLAIAQKLLKESKGYDQATQNAAAGKDLLNVADGGLKSIEDGLQRIRELSIQASNGIYGKDDLSAIQDEIEQIKGGIQDAAKNTQFNKINLLDGSRADIQLATNPSGGGMKIELYNSTLEELGIADYDVTKNFDISDIDNAMKQVSGARGSIGAQSNALDSTIRYNGSASYNNTASYSRISDTDYYEEITKKKQEEAMEKYRIFAQKAQLEQKQSFNKVLGIQ